MRTQWTDELIEKDLREMSANLGHFPSALDMRQLKRNDLACIVSKRGGFLHWSERIGVARRESDSDFGWQGEEAFCVLLRAQGIKAERQQDVKSPFDILTDDIMRVDVK